MCNLSINKIKIVKWKYILEFGWFKIKVSLVVTSQFVNLEEVNG